MRIDHFKYLVEVARLESISLAAKRLHVSQPTISLAINALEKKLEKKLFNRTRHGTFPTDDGKMIIEKVKEVLSIIEEIEETNPGTSQLSGTLSISAVPGFNIVLFPNAFVHFKRKFPGVTIEFFEGGSFQIEDNVRNEKIDLGFIAIDEPNLFDNDDKLVFKQLALGQVMACVGSKSPLAKKKQISLKEIIHYPIITLAGYRMYQSILKLLPKYGEPVLLNSGNRDIGRQVLQAGIGIGFISSLIIDNDPYFTTQKLIPIPISDANINLHYGYIKLKNKYLSRGASEFIKILENDPSK